MSLGIQPHQLLVDWLETVAGHLEEADLLGRTEPVLDPTQDPVAVVLVTFKAQDHVHQMLKQLGARQGAFLGHVADQDDRHAGFLGQEREFDRTPAKLGDGTGPTGGISRALLGATGPGPDPRHLDGIEDEQPHLEPHRLLEDPGEVGFSQDIEPLGRRTVSQTQSICAHAYLGGTFLAAGIENTTARAERTGHLHEQGALADTGVTAQQDRPTGHEPTAQHPVDLFDAGGHSRELGEIHFMKRAGLAGPLLYLFIEVFDGGIGHRAGGGIGRRPGRGLGEGRQGIPGVAFGAAAHPLGLGRATLVTDETGSCLGHDAKCTAGIIDPDRGCVFERTRPERVRAMPGGGLFAWSAQTPHSRGPGGIVDRESNRLPATGVTGWIQAEGGFMSPAPVGTTNPEPGGQTKPQETD